MIEVGPFKLDSTLKRRTVQRVRLHVLNGWSVRDTLPLCSASRSSSHWITYFVENAPIDKPIVRVIGNAGIEALVEVHT